jgi:hypothetical protein
MKPTRTLLDCARAICGQQQAGGRGAHDGGTAGEDETAGGHEFLRWFSGVA